MNSAIEENPAEKEVAPLFLFLASSLNVELVYIILKGITSFGYLDCNMDGQHCAITTAKVNKIDYERKNGDCIIRLKEIKVNDYKKWCPENEADLIDTVKDVSDD